MNFATTALPEGSPLRTMYLLFAGQPKEIFRLTPPQLLEKWRANLAAILSTSMAHPSASQSNAQMQGERRVAAELGDRLWAMLGRVEAAHCCYLLAELNHGPFGDPNSRVVLLGADHKRKRASSTSAQQKGFPTRFTVNTDAIMRSEVYEFTKVLGNSQYVLPGIHPYKLTYATLMADLGFTDVAAQYHMRAHKGGGHVFTPHYLYQLDTFDERLQGAGARGSMTASGGIFSRMTRGFSRFLGSDKPTSPTAEPAKKGSGFKPTPVAAPAPAAETPKKDSSYKPRDEPPAATKEEEDYANAFSTKPSKKAEAKQVEAEKEKKPDDDGQPQRSRWKFWQRSGKEVKLGEENSFIWDANLKMYIERGRPPPEPEQKPPPPPTFPSTPTPSPAYESGPLTNSSVGLPPMSGPPTGGFPPTPSSGGMPPMGGGPPTGGIPPAGANSFTSPVAAGGRRKPRYFDSLNDQVYTAKSGSTPLATPEKGNLKPFIPFTPPPTSASAYPTSPDPLANTLPPLPTTPPPPQY